MNARPPKIESAPGLTWKPRKAGWEARWQCRTDIAERGYEIKSLRLWSGSELSPIDIAYIQDRCNSLQADMLVWGRGGLPEPEAFDGTIDSLIRCYQSDPDSTYRKLRYRTRIYYDTLCRCIGRTKWTTEEGAEIEAAETSLSLIKARVILRWHEQWSEGGKIAMGHSMVGMLRTLFGFGATILEDAECERLSGILHKMRFTMAKARNERLTADQVIKIRTEAHRQGRHSIALAQAFQFECMFRQKDVIGEWVPVSEAPFSDVIDGNNKWLRGIVWREIDSNLVLTHVTSKRQKEIVVDLKLAPMVLEELDLAFPGWDRDRSALPANGPIIIGDSTGIPWYAGEFRRRWRVVATAAGVPRTVRNMDSRAGAISEATDAGADLEHVRHAATHSDIGMTQRYSRGGAEKTAGVMKLRAASRTQNKTGT